MKGWTGARSVDGFAQVPDRRSVGLRHLHERRLTGKLFDEALVGADGLVFLILFAVAFCKAENGGGGELALRVVVGDDGVVGFNGLVEVACPLLGEEGLLELPLLVQSQVQLLLQASFSVF